MNDYFQQVPDYEQKLTDISGIPAIVQNTNAQQKLMQQNASGMGQLSNQALGQAGGTNPLQAMAQALRAGTVAKPQAGGGQMYDSFGRVVTDPTYGNIYASSYMKNANVNPYENPI
jgi:hypothetical protein